MYENTKPKQQCHIKMKKKKEKKNYTMHRDPKKIEFGFYFQFFEIVSY